MILHKPIHKVAMLIPYEQLFIQAIQPNSNLISEYYNSKQTPLFQLVIDADHTS
jgi:hypothetical protein